MGKLIFSPVSVLILYSMNSSSFSAAICIISLITFCFQNKISIIVKIFQIYSFLSQISFKNDSTGHVFLVLKYCL